MAGEIPTLSDNRPTLAGERIALLGQLAGMSKREAARLIREHGGQYVEKPDATCTLLIWGEAELPVASDPAAAGLLDDATRAAAEQKTITFLRETELWHRMELVDAEQAVQRLYTPAMLAELLGVSVAIIRRWHRRGLIVPVREVYRLPYFDFREVSTARRLAELLGAGCSPAIIERQLADLQRYLPHIERPLAQLSIIVEGKKLLLRQGDGLVAPGGQYHFDFEAAERPAQLSIAELPGLDELQDISGEELESLGELDSPEAMRLAAAELEDLDRLAEATEMYRAALASGGPHAETNFRLAELLYRSGNVSGARERYYVALEIDEDYVEARANLGCVLAELGELELAVAAFRGALAFHEDFPDVHFHLARTLEDMQQPAAAATHWEAFVKLAPDSPWAAEARERLSGPS